MSGEGYGSDYWQRFWRKQASRRQVIRGAALGALGIAGASVVGCGSGQGGTGATTVSGAPTTAAGTAGTPRQGGSIKVLGYDPPGWDPQKNLSYKTQTGVSPVLSKLFRQAWGKDAGASDFSPKPDLAESYEQPDETTYIFKLRQDVKWQNKAPVNGRQFDSTDVKYTLERFLSLPENPQKYYFEDVSKIETPDRFTVKITTKAPSAVIIDNLANPTGVWILAREVGDKYGDFNKPEAVIGTGPWMLDSYQPNVSAVYKRNPDYFMSGRPYLDEMQRLVMPDAATQFSTFVSGGLDSFSVSRENLPQLKTSKPDARIQEYDYLTAFYLYWNTQNPPFNSKQVRQAIALALDKDSFIKGFDGGKAAVGSAVPASFTPWYLDIKQQGDGAKYYGFDLAAAKKLLADGGYPNGFETTMIGYNYGATLTQEAEWTVDALSKIGIKVKYTPLEYSPYIATAYGGNLQGMGWEPSTPYTTIDDYLYGVYYSGGTKNQSRVTDPTLDKMLDAQRRTTKQADRKKIIDDIQKYLADACYMVFLDYPVLVQAYQARLKDAYPHNGYDQGTPFVEAWVDK